ncbi:hypothetical protein CPB83DRAFT_850947 [Crepidotus variabilis]|uniref:Uncharacterized protein n=1 Tax=Crepidotus variabilis TaxID=179855 RepID=A0A9P6EJZ9_9AGAR|nr:hypothetical protein CPB83DRAFT_850947 [Crepidotus variabilis]
MRLGHWYIKDEVHFPLAIRFPFYSLDVSFLNFCILFLRWLFDTILRSLIVTITGHIHPQRC